MAANSTPETKTTTADGTVQEIDGRYVLRFERRLAHPVEKVWDALTQPERIVDWWGEGDVELDLVEGGRYRVRTTGPPELVEAIIAEAGDVALVGGDPGSIARWELRRDGDGCRLVLTHTAPPGFDPAYVPRTLAGWHTVLDRLRAALDRAAVPWEKRRFDQHHDRYASKMR